MKIFKNASPSIKNALSELVNDLVKLSDTEHDIARAYEKEGNNTAAALHDAKAAAYANAKNKLWDIANS